MSYSETITRTDLTNILNEVFPLPANTRLQYVGDYGSTIFNGTWTATDNGIMIQMLGSNTSGSNAYWYINDTTENKPVGCISFTANGTTNSASFPIVKGHTYASSAVNAVKSATAYFFKFVTGIFSQADEADYIVEQGTSGIWTYRKWNSGIAECWGRAGNNSIPSGWSTTGVNLALPFTFKTMKNWQIQHQNYQVSNCYGYPTTISNTYDNINIQTNASEAMSTATFMILCQGTWK